MTNKNNEFVENMQGVSRKFKKEIIKTGMRTGLPDLLNINATLAAWKDLGNVVDDYKIACVLEETHAKPARAWDAAGRRTLREIGSQIRVGARQGQIVYAPEFSKTYGEDFKDVFSKAWKSCFGKKYKWPEIYKQ